MGKLKPNPANLGKLLEFLNSTGWSDEERETRLAEALAAYYLKATAGEVQKTWMLEMSFKGLRRRVEIQATSERPPGMLTNGVGSGN